MTDQATPAKVRLNDQLGSLIDELREVASYKRHECVQVHFSLLTSAADMLEKLEPWPMALCERHMLVLRVGQPYIFDPVDGCESCAEALEQAKEAYGPDAGEPNAELTGKAGLPDLSVRTTG